MWHWPAAEPREAVDLAGAGTVAPAAAEANLGAELRRWRGIVGRRRLVALVRRNGALALGLAAVLEILAQLGLFPQWVVVAVPLVAFLGAVAFFVARGPSPFELARLLDDKLGLNDRLATALEIEARGTRTPLERRTVADAAALLAAGREDWHASPARGGREWWALAAPVAALLVVVAIGAAAGGSSASGPTEALAPKTGAGGAGEHGKGKKEVKSHKQLAPTGKLHKFKGKKVPPSAVEDAKAGYRKIPQGYRTSGKEGKGGGPESGKSTAKHIEKAAEGKAGANENSQGNKSGNGPNANNEAEHPTVGFSVKSQKKGGNHGRPGNSEVGGAGAKKSGPNGQGDETSATASEKKGAPAGTNHAGTEAGNNRQGHAKSITGAQSQAVKIQPGYAPSRAAKGGKEKKKTGYNQGAGGKARTATVTGGTQLGDEFSFVPAAGGAVPGPSAGLQLNYLESLKWIERLPW